MLSGREAISQAFDLVGVERFTLPVRDLAKAEVFYTQVLGGEVAARNAREIDSWEHPSVRVAMCPGVDVVLVLQAHGWQPIDVPNPHWGFSIPGADLEAWVRHLGDWDVPTALQFRDYGRKVEVGERICLELHFLDPDGNQMELVAADFIMDSHPLPTKRYDPWQLYYSHATWPRPLSS